MARIVAASVMMAMASGRRTRLEGGSIDRRPPTKDDREAAGTGGRWGEGPLGCDGVCVAKCVMTSGRWACWMTDTIP